jgi:hypothetical protein
MWIAMSNTFLSIVQPLEYKKPIEHSGRDVLLVRSRREGDIEAVFPKAEVIANAGTDYKYRAYIDRSVVATTITQELLGIHYDNFKNSVTDRPLQDAYFNVWNSMHELQQPRYRQQDGQRSLLGDMMSGECEGGYGDFEDSTTEENCEDEHY